MSARLNIKRAAIYARYSTDLQSPSSITDQIRLCRKICEDNGWEVRDIFTDDAISGGTHLRPGFQKLQRAAQNGDFDIIVSEALDRLSRDQEHSAGLYKQMCFLDIDIITKFEGKINEMHIGLGGTMNALFLKNLGHKTHRGLAGRVEAGKSGGGRSYGYTVDRQPLADGTFITGELIICPEEATVVKRIFADYDKGLSTRAIAMALNAEGIPAPRSGKGSGTWSFSTISGNWKRGTGILNNELYKGERVWNRQRYIKDPNTGKRQARLNLETEWVRNSVPELRLIDDNLWQRVKRRQGVIRSTLSEAQQANASNPLARAKRTKHLFSGLLKCGCCGGSYTLMNKTKYGCASARNKGTCDNRELIKREHVEERILRGLKSKLMHPELLKEFVAEYHREWNRLNSESTSARTSIKRELKQLGDQIDKIVEAITAGMFHASMKTKMDDLEARKAELESKLEALPDQDPIVLHPAFAETYRTKIAALADSLNHEASKSEASELLRGLVSEVRLHPDESAEDGHVIELYGELAAILELSGPRNYNTHRFTGGLSVQVVAGVGFEPTTFRL
ncbi:recombinase family protein [Epibacterium ulvae]|uniref:recombinase family protein n=1 Tax=Epibacterium ulvae TaxID=1156985 RepID=UPI001BFC3383|nr:recombinase family protein [Epibacterium ulvae]MBT8155151.1 recombinase family protein [Epibacterium ulvae]